MKKLLLIALLLPVGVISCTPPLEKPFVIVNKNIVKGHYEYYYQDKTGVERYFEDTRNYSIGDTIK